MTEDIWTFLRSCQTCGEPHEVRPARTPPDGLWTWASPADGHIYRPYLQPEKVADLRATFERLHEQTPA